MTETTEACFLKLPTQKFAFKVVESSIIIDPNNQTLSFDRIKKDGSIEHYSLVQLSKIEYMVRGQVDVKE